MSHITTITVSKATYDLILDCSEILEKETGTRQSVNMTIAEILLRFRQKEKQKQ